VGRVGLERPHGHCGRGCGPGDADGLDHGDHADLQPPRRGRIRNHDRRPKRSHDQPSTVYFSGDSTGISPERWLTSNFIQVDPGDGEAVQAIVSWDDKVFIFKQTKFAVVYGESPDQQGNPIFNFRRINAGVGAVARRAVCTGTDGVYFMDETGIYRTAGGTPERISDLIDPIFNGSPSPFYRGISYTVGDSAVGGLHVHNRRLFVAFDNAILVYDTTLGWWSYWESPVNIGGPLTSFRIDASSELIYGALTSIYHQNSAQTSDAGNAITSRWRSGWFDYGLSNDKTIRETKLWGSGKVSLAISKDFETATGTADLVDLTPSSAVLKGVLRRRAVRGTVFGDNWRYKRT
jgi:hypothetical protein